MFRQFMVTKVMLGYHVQIGCQQVCVSEDRKDELKRLICDYIDNPEEMEKKYYHEGQTCREGATPTRVANREADQPMEFVGIPMGSGDQERRA